MKETNRSETPFGPLGRRLKRLRVSRKESLAEVSGAVEIDIDQLSNIELGLKRPNEEILLLLISHFGIKDEEADKLWKLAGYEQEGIAAVQNETQKLIAINPEDLKIVYTDLVHVAANEYGVIMNFMQGNSANNQPLAIARVGMSREHAQSVLEVLQKTLNQSSSKILPSPKISKKEKTDQ